MLSLKQIKGHLHCYIETSIMMYNRYSDRTFSRYWTGTSFRGSLSNANDKSAFNDISLHEPHCELVLEQYREYEYWLFYRTVHPGYKGPHLSYTLCKVHVMSNPIKDKENCRSRGRNIGLEGAYCKLNNKKITIKKLAQ